AKLGCLGPVYAEIFFLGLLWACQALVDLQFYNNDIPEVMAVWESGYLWYIILTFLMFIMFFKYLFYFSVKFNLFWKTISEITILPINWDFKGIFLLVIEIISTRRMLYAPPDYNSLRSMVVHSIKQFQSLSTLRI
ncbi:MAG: hypothetical protein QQN63_12525, partial [Nitrosopumilus sp.]